MIKGHYAPFIHTVKNAPFIYFNVLIALVPCVVMSVVYYGLRALILLLLSQGLFFFFDIIFSRLLRPKTVNRDYVDLSSIVSGTIFALLLPPGTSIDVVIIGVLFGSLVVKQIFGGVGSNLFNPAVAARLFIQILFPYRLMAFSDPMTDFLKLDTLIDFSNKTLRPGNPENIYASEVLAGNYATFIGIGSSIMIMIGISYLLIKRIVRGYAFFGYMAGIIMVYPFLHLMEFFTKDGIKSFVIFILTSGVLFIAIFALGDFTTMPMNPLMRMFVSFICATLTLVIYDKVDQITGLLTPVLFINMVTPAIDYYTSTLTHKEIVNKKAGDAS
ncbi:MAG: RnfABCDGE type electron transport complex subunit D [Clostridiales bacterium]|nr:RnfABCDGE type electron transport complex subunit D [Clostridiales bacterium]